MGTGAGAMGGGGLMALGGSLMSLGLSMDQIQAVGKTVFEYARQAAGDDVMGEIAATIPGLAAVHLKLLGDESRAQAGERSFQSIAKTTGGRRPRRRSKAVRSKSSISRTSDGVAFGPIHSAGQRPARP